MKVLPIQSSSIIQKSSFKGKTKYFGYDTNHRLAIQDTPSNIGTDPYVDFTYQVKNLSPEFATVKNAFDRRKARTGKIYFGDPDEKIDFNQVLKEHDYAISDMEPSYPNIDKVSAGYFYDDNTRYEEHFQAISDFHDRREAAAKNFEAQYKEKLQKGINPQDSKEKVDYYIWQQQDSFAKRRQAQEALEIYNKANEIKRIKEEQGRELYGLEGALGSAKRDIGTTERSIENDKKRIEENNKLIESFKKRIKLYEELRKLPQNTENKLELKWRDEERPSYRLRLSIFENENLSIINNDDHYKKFITAYENYSKKISDDIIKQKNTIKELQEKIRILSQEVINKTNELNLSKSKLIPLFDELKNFYLKHGIK